jgi:hypothetical protein
VTSVYWTGEPPVKCETCGAHLIERFYDGVTKMRGRWALMCPSCFFGGPGCGELGQGRAQEYTRTEGNRWLKTRG